MLPVDKYFEFLASPNTVGPGRAEQLRDALAQNHAIIAGGSVLSAYVNAHYYTSDLDIYVHQKNALKFMEDIAEICTYYSSHTAPAYDMSFFKKNHILSRVRGEMHKIPVDIMIVDNSTKLEDVVQNFDLTFCEIWYDPALNIVKSTEDVTKKHGYLRKEYMDALFKYDNFFIKQRIRKYKSRGFLIELPKNTEPIFLEFLNNNIKKVENPEEWVVSHIVKNIEQTFTARSPYRQENLSRNILLAKFTSSFSKFTVEQLEKNITKWIIPNIMAQYNLDEPVPFKAIYVVALGETLSYAYPEEDQKWKRLIKLILRVRGADVTEFIRHGSQKERYFKNYVRDHPNTNTNRDCEPLASVTEKAYNKFVTKNKEGLYLAEYEQVPLKTFLKEKGHIVLASPEEDALCFDYDYFKAAYKNKNDTWIYECTGRIIANTNDKAMQFDLTRPYIKICISKTGMNGYVPAAQIWSMLCSKRKVFFIKPHMLETNTQEQQMITHTVGHALATRHHSATMVSANHCQHGSNILIFDIHEYGSKLKFPGSAKSHSNSDSRSTPSSSST